MRKNKINFSVIIISIILLFLVGTGIASWVITISKTFKPEYLQSGEVISSIDASPVVYDGNYHIPLILNDEIINDSKYVIKYSTSDNPDWFVNIQFDSEGLPSSGPMNAGTYSFKYENVNNKNDYVIVPFEIKQAVPTLLKEGYPTLGSTIYGQLPSMTKSTSSILATHPNHIESTDASPKSVLGDYIFTNEESTRFTDYIGIAITSTVTTSVRFVPSDKINYTTVDVDVPFTLEAVAKLGENYYGRIEDALISANTAKTGTVIALIGKNPTIYSDCSIDSGVTLVIGYDDSGFIGNREGTNQYLSDSTKERVSTHRKNNVTISPNITLTVNGGTLSLDGVVGSAGQKPSGGTSGDFAQITMDSYAQIKIKNAGVFNCYGYVKETVLDNYSKVNVLGGNIYMPFVIYDYRGGTNTVTVYKKENISPFNTYDMPNIQTELYLNSSSVGGSTGESVIYGLVDLYANSAHNTDQMPILSTNSGTKGIINITSGYIKTKFNPTTLGLTTGESDTTTIEVRGNGSTTALTLKVSVMITVTITLESVYFPVSWKYNIGFYDGTFTVDNMFKLLPGSRIYIDESAKFNISSDGQIIIYSSFVDKEFASCKYPQKPGSEFVVNGQLNVDQGALAGIIKTENTGAKLVITENTTTSLSSKEGNSGTTSSTDAMQIGMGTNVNAGEFVTAYVAAENAKGLTVSSGNYYSSFSAGTYMSLNGRWYSETCMIYYDANGGELTGTSDFEPLDGTYSTPYTINKINTSNPYREHYNFVGWYADAQGTIPVYTLNEETGLFEAHGYQIYCNAYVFAKWVPVEYNIQYVYAYLGGAVETGSVSNTLSTFNILTDTALKTPVHSNKYVFGGWFIDSEMTEPIGNFIGANFVASQGTTLYGKWYPEGTETYTITYETINNNDEEFQWDPRDVISINVKDYVHQDNCAKYNSDKTYPKYFKGWYIDQNGTTLFDSNTHLTENITIYGIWENKHEVTLDWGEFAGETSLTSITYFVENNGNFTFPNHSFDSELKDIYIVTYDEKWINGSNQYDGGSTSPSITQSLTYTLSKVELLRYYKVTLTNCYTQVVITLSGGSCIIDVADTTPSATYTFNSTQQKTNVSQVIYIQVGASVSCAFTYHNAEYNGYQLDNITAGTTIQKDTYKSGGWFPSYKGTPANPSTFTIGQAEYSIISSSGNSDNSDFCVFENAQILMADGSFKNVTEIQIGDLVTTWSFEEGKFVSRPVIFIEKLKNVMVNDITLYFDDETSVQLAGSQSYFDIDKLEYFSINSENVYDYIGTRIMAYDNGVVSSKKIIDCNVSLTIADTYEIITAYDFSFIYDNVLSMEPFLLYKLPFEINENLQYDKEQMQADIEKYGLYTYEEWSMYASEELFNLLNGKYFKVAIEKGNFTMEYLLEIIEKYLNEDNLT